MFVCLSDWSAPRLPKIAPRPPPNHPKTAKTAQDHPRLSQDQAKITPRPSIGFFCFLFQHIDFSVEKCEFGTNTRVSHYVLKRELALPRKTYDFELDIFVKERGGRAGRCMGSVPVAEMLASEGPGALPGGGVRSAADDPSNSLSRGDRSRESCGTMQLPQIIYT